MVFDQTLSSKITAYDSPRSIKILNTEIAEELSKFTVSNLGVISVLMPHDLRSGKEK